MLNSIQLAIAVAHHLTTPQMKQYQNQTHIYWHLNLTNSINAEVPVIGFLIFNSWSEASWTISLALPKSPLLIASSRSMFCLK